MRRAATLVQRVFLKLAPQALRAPARPRPFRPFPVPLQLARGCVLRRRESLGANHSGASVPARRFPPNGLGTSPQFVHKPRRERNEEFLPSSGCVPTGGFTANSLSWATVEDQHPIRWVLSRHNSLTTL